METTEDRTTGRDWIFYGLLLALFVAGSLYGILKEGGHEFLTKDAETGSTSFQVLPLGVSQGWKAIGLLVAVGLTLAFYSFLYKDNPFFKAAEHLYVGVGLGYLIVIAWFQYLKSELYAPLLKYWVRPETPGVPNYLLIIPGVLGIFLLARFFRRTAWMSRWAFAFIVGFGSGIAIPTYIQANILVQLEYTVQPIWTGVGWFPAFSMLVIVVGVISVLIYFYFSMEHKGLVGVTSKVGMWFLMVCFGASFGYTVMGRMALFVGRVLFLIQEWLKIELLT